MHISAHGAHGLTSLTWRPRSGWTRAGQHDTDGFALAAHPGQSQGRPDTHARSQRI